jgi:hypothetical protein
MAGTIYKRKGNFKGILFITGLLLIGLFLFYTQNLVNLLQDKSREYLKFRVGIFEEYINKPDPDINMNFFFNEVLQGADYPIIYSDIDMNPQMWINISPKLDTMVDLTENNKGILLKYLKEMAEENPPIPIQYQGNILGYYHYGVSPIIKRLQWLPYIEIVVVILFVLIGYVGFSQIKKNEERYIWIGMAKETAHQLGTPLSSINGWIEFLKQNPSNINQALKEMEVDALRLSKVAARFSQIGSIPSLKKIRIEKILENTISYFNKRLPQLGKKISISVSYKTLPPVQLNRELFEWVVENLIKNSIDAIESKEGKINISVFPDNNNKYINIDISDNGKGINLRDKKNVFKPGFSTKTRGWGLGLSLAKRIIEEYHKGKLILTDTHPGQGSTFRLMLSRD